MHPTLAGFYPFLLGSPARCAFLSYLCLYICLGSPARSRLSHSAVALTEQSFGHDTSGFVNADVMTLFLLLLLLWTFELYLILSYRYEDLLISWSYLWSYLDDLILAILSIDLRSYLLISWSYHLMMIQDTFLYMNFTLLLTCIWHAFDLCLSLTIDMHSTHVAAQHAFTLHLTCFEHTFYMCIPWGQHMDISI